MLRSFFVRQVTLVQQNADSIDKVIQQKRRNLEAICMVMQQKIYMIERKQSETHASMKDE
jgi:hypothetical protein